VISRGWGPVSRQDQQIPIKTNRDIVGRYRSILGEGMAPEEVQIEVAGDGLLLSTSRHERYPARIRQSGGVSVQGHHGAWLLRRGTQTLLRVGWCYRYGLYQRINPPNALSAP
jgi:hypothetical protein